ncbi:GNAT family N-acetyltransferase [Nocardioides zeae]|uniref:GNAT family N-acetyltransferase n=1 Tax=Nocardioides imazamoxiresistens TaxID=3231893 RepID=A0ABU3PU38_9ACTN|nr:GNAT family N-acetyltransferase [Nocardioides zeae]MDT9592742.1 GNAT family N-acetyltransferase [Nocardioides zeae]
MRTVLANEVPDRAAAERLAAAHARHVQRTARIDPLVRPGEPVERGRVLEHGAALGVATVSEQESLWAARRTHVLQPRIADGAEPDWGGLLDAWLAVVEADPAAREVETSAGVSLASRDHALVEELVRRHLGPASVLAVRTLDRPDDAAPPVPHGVVVRPATAAPDDLRWLLDRSVALQAWEAGLGYVPRRSEAEVLLGADLEVAIRRDLGWTWIAELDGEPVAFVQVNPPEEAEWVAGQTWLAPVGYLVSAYVDPALRSGGLGRVLVAAAHARARDDGWSALLLHHAASSAWSAPFWGSLGYRPLVTTWMRRPAVR